MGLEPEATRLPTTTSDWLSAIVLVMRTLISSLLSWISTTSLAVGDDCFALVLAPWIVPMEKLSLRGNATLGSTCCLAGTFDVLPPPVSCCTQSCCSNSATAAISVIDLGVLTGLQGAQPLLRLGCGRVVLIVWPSNITHGDYCSGTIVWYIGTLARSTWWLSIVHVLLGLIKTSTRLVFAILSGVCSRVHKLVVGSFYPHKIMLSL
jgi:hypothetical protein